MRRRWSEPGFVVSLCVHAAALGATLVAFADNQKFEDQQETAPVEVVTNAEFNQIMRGEKSAKEVRPEAVPKAEKIAEATETKPDPPTPDQSKDVPSPPPPPPPPPVKQAVTPPPPPPPPTPPQQVDVLPPPRPEPDPPQEATPPVPTPPVRDVEAEPMLPKPVPKPKPKPVVKPPVPLPPHPEVPKVHEVKTPPPPPPPKPQPPVEKPKFDLLAKLLNDSPTDSTPTPKPAVSKTRVVPDTSEAGKFDLTDISRLLSHDAPAQRASTAHDTSRVASLGSPTASAAKMSPSLWGALDGVLEDQYRQCWSYLGLSGQTKYIPQVRVVFAPNGGLQAEPVLVNPPSDPALQNLADSALRAVRRCNPLKIPDQFAPFYDQWKGRVLRFDPEEMAG